MWSEVDTTKSEVCVSWVSFLRLLLEERHVFLLDRGSDARMGTQDVNARNQAKNHSPFPENALSLRVPQAILGLDVTQPACLL